jgi:hypothetical protein
MTEGALTSIIRLARDAVPGGSVQVITIVPLRDGAAMGTMPGSTLNYNRPATRRRHISVKVQIPNLPFCVYQFARLMKSEHR